MQMSPVGTVPPPPPGAGFQRVAQELATALPISVVKAGVLADATVRSGRAAADAIAAWKSAYTINGVNQDRATVLGMVAMVAGARPNAIADAHGAAYSINGVNSDEAQALATRIVLRGYDQAQLRPTFDRLYSINGVSGDIAKRLTTVAVSANASSDQVVDSFAWYHAQPGGTAEQAATEPVSDKVTVTSPPETR